MSTILATKKQLPLLPGELCPICMGEVIISRGGMECLRCGAIEYMHPCGAYISDDGEEDEIYRADFWDRWSAR